MNTPFIFNLGTDPHGPVHGRPGGSFVEVVKLKSRAGLTRSLFWTARLPLGPSNTAEGRGARSRGAQR